MSYETAWWVCEYCVGAFVDAEIIYQKQKSCFNLIVDDMRSVVQIIEFSSKLDPIRAFQSKIMHWLASLPMSFTYKKKNIKTHCHPKFCLVIHVHAC